MVVYGFADNQQYKSDQIKYDIDDVKYDLPMKEKRIETNCACPS